MHTTIVTLTVTGTHRDDIMDKTDVLLASLLNVDADQVSTQVKSRVVKIEEGEGGSVNDVPVRTNWVAEVTVELHERT